jgi:protein tyrosine/serine phosphatase
MTGDRTVRWDGFYNARDLGGLPTTDGRPTARDRVYRSATLHLATRDGWAAAHAAGVRTIVSLLNDDEVPFAGAAPELVPAEIRQLRVPLDVVEDATLWDRIAAEGLDGTPLYYWPLLERHPERAADAVRAIARAGPGGVLFHCGAGRDRTGLVAALLLAVAGATQEAIAEDYVASATALPALAAALGRPSEQNLVDRALDTHGHTAHSAMLAFLAALDAPSLLRSGGLSDDDLARARDRLRR